METKMLIDAFLLAPYLAIVSNVALAVTVTAICCSQRAPRGAGFTA